MVPFRLPEYDDAFVRFVLDAARELAIARNELLAQVSFETSPGALGSVIQDTEGRDVDLAPTSTEIAASSSAAAIRGGDYVELLLAIDDMSAQVADSYMGSIISTITAVTEATGNVYDASGRPNFDVFLEMLEDHAAVQRRAVLSMPVSSTSGRLATAKRPGMSSSLIRVGSATPSGSSVLGASIGRQGSRLALSLVPRCRNASHKTTTALREGVLLLLLLHQAATGPLSHPSAT